MAINYDELEKELRAMKPRSKLFILVRSEMERRGHWKRRIRGFHVKKK